MNDFHSKLLDEIKRTYSINNKSLLNLSNIDTFINLGYPVNFLKNFDEKIKFSFPIVYPFKDINVKNKILADIGCGAGLDSLLASFLGAKKVIALDISKSFLKKINFKNVLPVNANVSELCLKKDTFDIVIMNGSLNLIYDKISLLRALYEILRKGGLIVIGDLIWCGTMDERDLYKNDIDSWCWCTGGCLTDSELSGIIHKIGYKLVLKEHYETIETLKRAKYILKK